MVGGALGFSSARRDPNTTKVMIQTNTNRKTVARTSEGLLDMVAGDGCGGRGGICDVGVIGSLRFAEMSRICLLLSGMRVANALP